MIYCSGTLAYCIEVWLRLMAEWGGGWRESWPQAQRGSSSLYFISKAASSIGLIPIKIMVSCVHQLCHVIPSSHLHRQWIGSTHTSLAFLVILMTRKMMTVTMMVMILFPASSSALWPSQPSAHRTPYAKALHLTLYLLLNTRNLHFTQEKYYAMPKTTLNTIYTFDLHQMLGKRCTLHIMLNTRHLQFQKKSSLAWRRKKEIPI